MAKKLLILGASGLTGYKAMLLARKRFEAYGTYNLRQSPPNASFIRLDITKEDDLKKVFKDIKPDVVLNTTALHNVDYCESHSEEAFNVNTKVVALISDTCNNLGCRLIHISTDYVFDGKKKISYLESDDPNPLSVYGTSKLDGEKEARNSSSYSIIRPSVVYGWTPLETHGSASSSGKAMNFALWALSKMKREEELKIVNDQYASPTLADILAAVALRFAEIEKNGLYHVSGTSCISRYDFTKKIAHAMGYSDGLIKPVESRSFAQAAQRPANSCLSCEKLRNELNYNLPDVDQSLAIMRSQIELDSPSLLGN